MSIEQTLTIHEEIKHGGAWLSSARTWIQNNIKDGDVIIWGSDTPVTVTEKQLEELALRVAIAAIIEDRNVRRKASSSKQFASMAEQRRFEAQRSCTDGGTRHSPSPAGPWCSRCGGSI